MYLKNENTYVPFTGTVVKDLDQGIYRLILDKSNHEYRLEYYEKKFSLPNNIIEVRKDAKDYIIESIANSTDNIGMLFTGIKGSGKTVMAKEICNKLNYPVILVDGVEYNEVNNLFNFLSGLKSNAIYMFDEFDKCFDNSRSDAQEKLLTFMDGLYNNHDYRKIFILTANSIYDINTNFFSRPSRLLYKLDFSNIESKTEITDIFKSYLIDKSDDTIKSLIEFLESKGKLNLDTILSVIKEVNKVGIDKFMNIGQYIINIEDDIISCEFEAYNDRSVTNTTLDKFVDKYLTGDVDRSSVIEDSTTIDKLPSMLSVNDVFEGYGINKVMHKDKYVFIETSKRGKQFSVITNSVKINKLL